MARPWVSPGRSQRTGASDHEAFAGTRGSRQVQKDPVRELAGLRKPQTSGARERPAAAAPRLPARQPEAPRPGRAGGPAPSFRRGILGVVVPVPSGPPSARSAARDRARPLPWAPREVGERQWRRLLAIAPDSASRPASRAAPPCGSGSPGAGFTAPRAPRARRSRGAPAGRYATEAAQGAARDGSGRVGALARSATQRGRPSGQRAGGRGPARSPRTSCGLAGAGERARAAGTEEAPRVCGGESHSWARPGPGARPGPPRGRG